MEQIINPNPAEEQLTFTAIYADGKQYNSSENGDYFDNVESINDYIVKLYNKEPQIERIAVLDFNGNILADTNEG